MLVFRGVTFDTLSLRKTVFILLMVHRSGSAAVGLTGLWTQSTLRGIHHEPDGARFKVVIGG